MNKLLANTLLTVVLGALVVAVLFGFNYAAAPQDRVLPTKGAIPPDPKGILKAVTEDSLRHDLEILCNTESRLTGSDGCDAAADYIETELTAAGYRVMLQPFDVAVPMTKYAEILDENDRPIEGIQISPLLPNWFRTCTTPPEGIRGTVHASEKGLAREFEGVALEGNFVLLPLGVPWKTVAGMGVGGVLYYDDDGANKGSHWAHTQMASVNVPRFLVEGDIASLNNRTIRIRARVDFENRPTRNIMGILDAPGATELVVVSTHYDSYSYVPDRAPGAGQACSPAALLAIARNLARDQGAMKRSVMLLATAGHAQGLFGVREFVRSLGTRDMRGKALEDAAADVAEIQAREELLEEAATVAADSAYWIIVDTGAERAYWNARSEAVQDAFTELYKSALDADLMSAMEATSEARVNWVREGMPVHTDDGDDEESFVLLKKTRKAQKRIEAMLEMPPEDAKHLWGDILAEIRLADRVAVVAQKRIHALQRHMDVAAARLTTARYLDAFESMLFLSIDIGPGSQLALVTGSHALDASSMPADTEVMKQLTDAGRDLDAVADAPIYIKDDRQNHRYYNYVRNGRGIAGVPSSYGNMMYFSSSAVLWAGHTAFALAEPSHSRSAFGTPFDTLDSVLDPQNYPEDTPLPMENLTIHTRVLCGLVDRFARRHGRIIPVNSCSDLYTIKGQVVSRVGESLTPNHPMPGALVRVGPKIRGAKPLSDAPAGMGLDFYVIADEEGRIRVPCLWGGAVDTTVGASINLDAAILRPTDGAIIWTLLEKDSGPHQPYSVRGLPLKQFNKIEATPVLFRSKPVQVVPMPDPATLQEYAAFGFLEKSGLAAPNKTKTEKAGGLYVCYVEPETRLYFTFKKGSFYNPNLTEVRAFALGAKGPADRTGLEDAPELAGDGYFAADNGEIANIEFDVALSMAQVNAYRLQLQQEHGIADELVVDYSHKAGALADKAIQLRDEGHIIEGKRLATESVAYSSNIHPVIRKQASDAIVGILFYLLLAVPFAVFMEKLLVGHPDIRIQIVFQGLIFLLFFVALRFLHPAYQLVRSSYMILLGFVTFTLAAMVSTFVSSRFGASIADLQQKIHQRTEVADVSRAGAATTAFILGLGHMRKRKVRTGLTAATLILTTFVMLCFTSVTTDVVDVEFAVGNAPYTGLLIRDRGLASVQSSLAPLNELYGRDHLVSPRQWAGTFDVNVRKGQVAERAEYIITHVAGTRRLKTIANACLGLSSVEPQLTDIEDVCEVLVRWFDNDRENACILPREMADELRINDDAVTEGTATVTMRGRAYTVLGIFNSMRLEELLDLDGEPMLPLDVLGLIGPGGQVVTKQNSSENEVPENVPRLPACSVVITPALTLGGTMASIAVGFTDMEYADARALISAHLEKSAETAYYGVDGVSFYGGKFRKRSVGGLLEIILPIIIAAITVLNTMRGSVYERKGEIYVFNSVGLSPTHIKALFLAEASVYAVVGAVGGYLLAQGIGAGLQALGLTGGLTMNYSSLASVFVSIVIMSVVMISSIFPARMAARLAAPSEMMTRQRHTAEGDLIEIDLPFVFSRRDRVAVIPYFLDWFQNFGEGSAGKFYCNDPVCGLMTEDHGGAAPYVETTTWLKPYDLGVSQSVRIVVRHDPETGDNLAVVQMQRLSGDIDSWERCCHAFIGLLRKRFLTWRAVTPEDRGRLLVRGRQELETASAV